MYPTIEFFGSRIYTFGLIMAFTWILFIVLLHRFAWKKGFTKPVFSSIVAFALSIFFFSRTFYILSNWVDQKFIFMELSHGNIVDFLKGFFMSYEYYFSLTGGIFGFFLVFLWKTRKQKAERVRYLDVVVLAFLYSAILGYFGTLLGGQVHGIPFDSPLSISYHNLKYAIVEGVAPRFPLAVLYMLGCAGIALGLRYMSKKTLLPDGFIGYFGMGLFSILIFLGEFLSGSRKDMFYDRLFLDLNQLGATIMIISCIVGIAQLSKLPK